MRTINENGEIIESDYLVQEVFELINDAVIEITNLGKRRIQKKAQDNAPNLFTYLDETK